jgi:hypothetical protein
VGVPPPHRIGSSVNVDGAQGGGSAADTRDIALVDPPGLTAWKLF